MAEPSFTYSLDDEIGKVRLAIGDRTKDSGLRPDRTNFSDAEIQFLIDDEGTWKRAVAAALEILAREWARVADLEVLDRKESLSKISARYDNLAQRVRSIHGGSSTTVSFSAGLTRVDGYSKAVE